ncbi:sterol O-acyltransferase 1 [Solenopsis invicta]|uniref:sterol O-acyltransferase 1 n=1 Tax=Solenopsis invicta TaxID=13686 RepID=UPI000E340274|nr:sterol O-acyltransferase 1 [Solenopsis invicta]
MSSVKETLNVKDFGVANDLHDKDEVINPNSFTDVLHETITEVLHKRTQEMRDDVLDFINYRINNMMSEVLQKIEVPSAKNGNLLHSTAYRDKNKKDELPDKEFLARNSLFTDLFEVSHIRTVYNLFMVIFILLFINTVAFDIMDSGTILLGANTLQICFAKFSTFLYIWTFMQASTLSVYIAFNLWAYQRLRFLPKSSIQKYWDYGWLSAFIAYEVLFFYFPIKAIFDEELISIGCTTLVIEEQLRLMMKSWAFVRSAAPRFLSYKPHSESPQPSSPKFSQYLYFLFAPTLVYRDEYPRTKRIRWTMVIWNFVEVVIAFMFFIFNIEHLVLPVYYAFDVQLEIKWFFKNIIKFSISGILTFITGQYLFLHAWMNAWAEMLRFADRLFYRDWWNSTTYAQYYRTWNIVVHDWLYTYIYKDMYEIVVPRNRMLSAAAVFFASAVVHEYALTFIFRFFYPVILILFGGVGFAFFFVRKYITSNVFMWMSWTLGTGIMVCLYTMEIYARWNNCSPYPNYYLDLLIPRSWSC